METKIGNYLNVLSLVVPSEIAPAFGRGFLVAKISQFLANFAENKGELCVILGMAGNSAE